MGRAGDSRLWDWRSLRARVDRLPHLGAEEHECCRPNECHQDPRHAQALRRIQCVLSSLWFPSFFDIQLVRVAGISSFLQDLNPALLTTIESEFDKVAADSPPEPTRVAVDTVVAAAPAAGGKAGKGKATDDDPLDELFPRVDLDKLVSSANANACNDTNWKMRKEALENIQSILEANKRLKPSNLCEFFALLGPCASFLTPRLQPISPPLSNYE